MSLRTPLGRVRGLGSAKEGTRHWWHQRLTAIALVPLSLWFVAALLAHARADYETAVAWVSAPGTTITLLLLIGALLYHAQLGLQVVIEDYVHREWLKLSSLIAMKFAALVLAILAAYGVLRVAFGA